MLVNSARYFFTRTLQRLHLADLDLQVGRTARSIIPNPPLIVKAFTTKLGRDELLRDPNLQSVLKLARSASTFWDVGANIGLFSILAREANPDLKIVSIEASTDFYHVLCRNWQLAPEGWICLHVAVGDCEGSVQMSRGLKGLDHVLTPTELGSQERQECRPMMTLDHLCRLVGHDRIDLLKIDVEGMELSALRGASGLLEANKIGTIVLEADQHDLRYGSNNTELIQFLASKGYHLDAAASVTGKSAGNCQVFEMKAASRAAY